MDHPEQIFEWTLTERLGLADFLDDLGSAEWRVNSLCPGWTVHDVLAHLTLATRTGYRDLILGLVRSGGSAISECSATRHRARPDRF